MVTGTQWKENRGSPRSGSRSGSRSVSMFVHVCFHISAIALHTCTALHIHFPCGIFPSDLCCHPTSSSCLISVSQWTNHPSPSIQMSIRAAVTSNTETREEYRRYWICSFSPALSQLRRLIHSFEDKFQRGAAKVTLWPVGSK